MCLYLYLLQAEELDTKHEFDLDAPPVIVPARDKENRWFIHGKGEEFEFKNLLSESAYALRKVRKTIFSNYIPIINMILIIFLINRCHIYFTGWP